MIDWIYPWWFFTFVLIIIGFIFKEYYFGSAAAVSLVILGIYGIGHSFPDMSEWGNTVFSIFAIIIGFYILIRGTLEQFYK